MRDGAKQGFPDWIWKLPTLAASYRLIIVWKSLLSSILSYKLNGHSKYMTDDITAMWSNLPNVLLKYWIKGMYFLKIVNLYYQEDFVFKQGVYSSN